MKKLLSSLVVCCVFLLSGFLSPGSQVRAQKPVPFDSYGAISSEDAAARLDNFAIELQNRPDAIGFVISYGPQGDGSGTGNFLLRVTQDYLVNSRGIDPDRIQTIYAGRFKDPATLFTELWILSAGLKPPEPHRYSTKLKKVSGRFTEAEGWDGSGVDECGCGPSFGNTTLASFADLLREQPKDVGYIVAFNMSNATPGAWRRVAKSQAADLQEDGIGSERIKIIYGGTIKAKKEESANARLQYWILPSDAPPPVKEAKPERTPKDSVRIGAYGQYDLKYPKQERRIFEGFADVLRVDEQLRVYLIVRSEIPSGEKVDLPEEPPDIDEAKLVEKWKSELRDKLGIKENRIFIIHAGADEYKGGTVEVWVVPPGASFPDPYASDEEQAIEEP